MQRHRKRSGRRERSGRGVIGWCAAGAAAFGAATGAPPAAVAEDASPPPVVGLDKLLKIPDSLDLEPATRGRTTKAEWRARFEEARAELAAAGAALAETQAKLEEVASETSAWKIGAPGLGPINTGAIQDGPLDYSLSNEMRRNREEVERGERRLTELEIEATLAGVPAEWYMPEPADEPSRSQEPE